MFVILLLDLELALKDQRSSFQASSPKYTHSRAEYLRSGQCQLLSIKLSVRGIISQTEQRVDVVASKVSNERLQSHVVPQGRCARMYACAASAYLRGI